MELKSLVSHPVPQLQAFGPTEATGSGIPSFYIQEVKWYPKFLKNPHFVVLPEPSAWFLIGPFMGAHPGSHRIELSSFLLVGSMPHPHLNK